MREFCTSGSVGAPGIRPGLPERQDGAWFPVAVTQLLGSTLAAKTDEQGRIVSFDPRAYADLRTFAGVLLTNIKDQQGLTCPVPRKGGNG